MGIDTRLYDTACTYTPVCWCCPIYSSMTTDFTVDTALVGNGLVESPLSLVFWSTGSMVGCKFTQCLKETCGHWCFELQESELGACSSHVNDVAITSERSRRWKNTCFHHFTERCENPQKLITYMYLYMYMYKWGFYFYSNLIMHIVYTCWELLGNYWLPVQMHCSPRLQSLGGCSAVVKCIVATLIDQTRVYEHLQYSYTLVCCYATTIWISQTGMFEPCKYMLQWKQHEPCKGDCCRVWVLQQICWISLYEQYRLIKFSST